MPSATSKKPQESKSTASSTERKDAAPSRSVSGDRKDGPAENDREKVASLIDKKIRNLEKRKIRLDGIKEQQAKGRTVTSEQKAAVEKLDEVDLLLDNFRELQKALKPIMDTWERTQKKEEKARDKERMTQETSRIKELLRIQEALKVLRDPETRTHFENGTNGALKLEKDELDVVDKCQGLISPEHGEGWETKFKTGAQNNYNLLTGSSKPFIDGKPYKEVRELFNKILGSDFFVNQGHDRSTSPVSEEKSVSASPVSSEEPPVMPQQSEIERVQETSQSPPVMAPITPMVFENSALSMRNGNGPVLVPQPQDHRIPIIPVAPAVNFGNTGIEPQMPGTHGSNFNFIQEDQSGAVGSPPQMGINSSMNHHLPYQGGQAGASEIPNMGYTNSVYSSNIPPPEQSFPGYGVQPIFPVQQPRDPPPPIPMPEGGPNPNQRKDLDPAAAPFVSGSRSLFTAGEPAVAGVGRQNSNSETRQPDSKKFSLRNSTSEGKDAKSEPVAQPDVRVSKNGEVGPDKKDVTKQNDSRDPNERPDYRSERRGRGTGGIYRGGYRGFRGQDGGGHRGVPRGGRGNGWSRGGPGWNRGHRGGSASNTQHHQQPSNRGNTATVQ